MRRAFTQVQQRPPAPGDGRDSRRSAAATKSRTTRRTRRRRGCASAPDPHDAVDRAGRRAGRGRAARDLRRPGRALRAGLAAAARAGRAARSAGDHQSCRARARSRKTIRCRSARAARSISQAAAPLPEQRGPHLRHRLQLHHRPTTAWPCPRASASSTPRSTRSTSTRTSWPSIALVGDAGLTLEALIAEVKDRLKGKPRGRDGRRHAGDHAR